MASEDSTWPLKKSAFCWGPWFFFSVVSKKWCMHQTTTKKNKKHSKSANFNQSRETLTILCGPPTPSPPKKKKQRYLPVFQTIRTQHNFTSLRFQAVHQLPKRLCAFARVAVRCAVALGMPVRGRLGPASLGRAGALAGRGKRLDLKGKLKGKVTEKGWKISQLVVFFFLLLHRDVLVHAQKHTSKSSN